jgi:hypothetical protein
MTGHALRQRLTQPAHEVSIEALAAAWFQTDITLTLGPSALPVWAGDPGIADRVRGALGRALMEGASAQALAEQPCTWDPPCSHDVLWNGKGSVRAGVDIPKPFRLSVWPSADAALCVTLSLFGVASDWAEPAAEALVRAFRGGLSLDGGPRRGWEVVNRTIAAAPPLPPSPFPASSVTSREAGVVLAFHTPFAPRRGDQQALDPLALLTGLSRRAEGMARWHDAHLQVQGQALADAAAALSADTTMLRSCPRLRPPNRGRAVGIPLDGQIGPYALTGPDDALAQVWPLLTLGTAFGAGSRTSLGYGGYHLSALTAIEGVGGGRRSVEKV